MPRTRSGLRAPARVALSLAPARVALSLALAACAVETPPPSQEVVFTHQPASWFEDGWSFYQLSPDAGRAVFGARFGRRLFDLAPGREGGGDLSAGMERVDDAFFDGSGRFWRRGVRAGLGGWFVDGDDGSAAASLPADAYPRLSPDGSAVAYYRGTAGSGSTLFVGPVGEPVEHDLGGLITGMAWAPAGDTAYAMVFRDDGTSALYAVDAAGGGARLIREHLDATARFNSIAVSGDGRGAYLALVGPEPPDPEARHRPDAGRDMDLYRMDLSDGSLDAVVTTPGDDFHPQVVDGSLYWTHNDYLDVIAVVPAEGGDPVDVVSDGQIPYWSPDGTRIAYTVGGWALADWALNLDAWVVDLGPDMRAAGEPRPIVTGYHEDFTPAWSPDGRWLAYHSHRSATPVAHYFAPGATDDVWVRRVDAPMSEEIRVTDFGWEVGMADWSRDGRKLVFDSWDRGGPPGVSHPWIVTLDRETGRAVSVERLPLPQGFGGTVLAAWSPVADELAVVEHVDGRRHALWLLDPDGSMPRRVVEFDASTYGGVDFTPDGRRLVYGASAGDRMQLFSVATGGGEPRQLTRSADDFVQPQVSPDGRWIAATRMRHVKELRRMALR